MHNHKQKRKDQNCSFFLCLHLCLCAATRSENEIPLRHNTSTRIFTTRGYVWTVKTLDPDCQAPKQVAKFGWFASSFVFTWLLAFVLTLVLASLMKHTLKVSICTILCTYLLRSYGPGNWEINFTTFSSIRQMKTWAFTHQSEKDNENK